MHFFIQTYQYENDERTEITLRINNDCSSISNKNGVSGISKNQQILRIQKTSETPSQLKVSALDFPSWLQGQWQHLNILKNKLVFRDHSSFKSFHMTLVNQLSEEKFIVLSRSQCGEESFKCLWIRKMHENILEFQTSSESAKKLTSYVICNEEHFDDSRWLTQASEFFAKRINFPSLKININLYIRLFLAGVGKDVRITSCPINGKYFGRLPDDLELCSTMTSSCKSDVMHFQVGHCDSSEIYEKTSLSMFRSMER